MKEKALIFDLDGTLIDSLTDIALCANKVLKEFNLPTHSIEDYKTFVGGGADILIKNCTPTNSSKELRQEVLEQFKIVYDQNLQGNTKPYDGVYELLEILKNKNYKLGVLSNKPHKFTLKYIEQFFSFYNISEPHGQKEEIPKKPNPIGAINIAKSFNLPSENIYFIGDSDVDMQTAKNAGMIAVGVKWGFRGVEELLENGADFIVETPLDILKLLEEKN
ncbi:HAD family hydrolase [Arcobacter sp. LA11]|uniref:HAD family hydrolase n=1 Tax=Arcobacter sp. LA11 TaxID=1898176 RepID=UPI000934B460|nr:HAD family hydrolase [Arcobacter sp. LA11]